MSVPRRRTAWSVFAAVVAVALLLPVASAGAQLRTAAATTSHLAFATHAIARGEVLTADDFQFRDTTSRAPIDSTPVEPGWVTRRAIAAGEVLRVPAVVPPALVRANQPVEIVWQQQNITLVLRGTATRNGALGERVSVRTDQGKRIEATVIAAGRVRID